MTIVEWISLLDRWFFEYRLAAEQVATIRILAVGVIVLYIAFQAPDIIRFSSPRGMLDSKTWLKCCEQFPQLSVYAIFPQSQLLPWVVLIGLFVSGMAALIGMFSWLSLLVFLVCVTSTQSRVFPILFSGGDSVVRMLLICLILSDSSAAWSIDAWHFGTANERVSGWPMRVLQIYLCSIYWNAAYYKLTRSCWTDGHASRDSAMSGLWGRRASTTIQSDWLSKSASRCVLLYESMAPLTFWVTELTLLTMAIGMMLHGGVWSGLRIGNFGPIMIVGLLAFSEQLFP